MTTAAIYCRISKDRLNEGQGVARQEEDCRALAEANGWTVLEVYTDNDVSAYSRKRRPQFERLMSELGRYDALIVWSTDRLYRRMTDLERIVDTLNGTRVATVKSGDIDLTTADGRSVARILGSLAQRESEKTGERVSAAALDRAKRGRSTSSHRPFGWNLDGTQHPVEAQALRDAFSMLLEGASMSGIARELTARGLTSTEGGPIRQAKVSAWLRAPRNAGIVQHRGQAVGQVEGIVDMATWNAAQAILADPARRPKKGRPHSTLLGGLLECGTCGSLMRPSSNSVNRGNRIMTYACEPHRHVNRGRDAIDERITALIDAYISRNSALIAERIAEQQAQEPDAAAELRQQLTALAGLLATGRMGLEAYTAASGAIEAQIRQSDAPKPTKAATASLLASGGNVADLGRDQFRALFVELIERAVVPAGGGDIEIHWR